MDRQAIPPVFYGGGENRAHGAFGRVACLGGDLGASGIAPRAFSETRTCQREESTQIPSAYAAGSFASPLVCRNDGTGSTPGG